MLTGPPPKFHGTRDILLTLAQIVTVPGEQPDSGIDRGSLSPLRREPRAWSSWAKTLSWPATVHGGTDGLPAAIEALGLPLAQRLAILNKDGCDVGISVYQELSDDQWSAGIHLTEAAIEWIAAARAAIDQYAYKS